MVTDIRYDKLEKLKFHKREEKSICSRLSRLNATKKNILETTALVSDEKPTKANSSCMSAVMYFHKENFHFFAPLPNLSICSNHCYLIDLGYTWAATMFMVLIFSAQAYILA